MKPHHPSGRPLRARHLLSALLAAAMSLAGASAAFAQEPSASPAVAEYRIAAGGLSAVLSAFAGSAGITLAIDPALVQGKESPGLSGTFSVQDGLARLLAGSGLRAVNRGNGGYVLQRLPEGATLLPTVKVEAGTSVFDTGATEGSGSYAAAQIDSATGLSLSPRRTPHSLSVVTREQMEDQNLTSLFDVLAQVPGIQLNHVDSERFDISSRGAGVNMMIDGNPTRDYLGGPSTEVMMINTATLDRVEVVRGSTGLMNGTGSYGGSVNLVRKRPVAGGQTRGVLGAGSWDRYQAEVDVSSDLTQDGSLRGRWLVSTKDGGSFTDYYDRSERVLYGIVEKDLAPATSVSLGIEKFIADVDGSSFSHIPLLFDDGSVFEAPHSFNPAPRWTETNLDNTTVFADLHHRFNDDWKLTVSAAWFTSKADLVRAGFSPWQGLINKETGMAPIFRSLVEQEGDRYTFNAKVEGAFEAFGRQHELLFGANYHRSELGRYTSRFYFDDGSASVNVYDWPNDLPPFPDPNDYDSAFEQPNDTRETALLGAAQLHLLDPLAVILGTRWQRLETTSSFTNLDTLEQGFDGRRDSGRFVPYAALLYDFIPSATAYLSYTDIFNLQDFRDRNGKLLPPERGENYEAGIKAEFFDGGLQPSLSFYRQQLKNAAVEDVGFMQPDGEAAYRAVDGVIRRGWDFTIAGEPLRGLTLQGGIGATRDSGVDEESRFLNVNAAWAATSKFSIGGNFTQKPKRTMGIAYSEAVFDLGSLTLLDLFASYRLSRNLRAFINVENVTDKRYIESAGTYGTYLYGPDRNLMLTLRYTR